MDGVAPLELSQLLRASDSERREAAWEELIAQHTRLLLAVSRSFGGGADEAMDRYAYILEKLHDSDCRRLRAFDSNAGATFPTWLTVTGRHLCLDYHRARYGRSRPSRAPNESDSLRSLRRTLVDSLGPELDVDLLPDLAKASAEDSAVLRERDSILRAELARLSSRDRLLLALRYQDGLAASRIAAIVGIPTPFHVYRQLNGILGQLRASLESRGVDGVDG
jgi:RNA polymerase sigma factor (sigma-70 family)